jgi:cell division protease FtsH
MSPTLGRARLLASDVDQYLGSDSAFAHISEETHQEFDHEIRRLLHEGEVEAMRILEENRSILDRLSNWVHDNETAEGKDLAKVLAEVPSNLDRLSRVFGDSSGNGRVVSDRATAATRPTKS